MDIAYDIVRSKRRKKVTLTVERDRRVVVHAPEQVSDEKIDQIIQQKRQWILEKMGHEQKYATRSHPPGKELVSGESALYLGRTYRLEIVKNDQETIHFDGRFYIPAHLIKKGKEVLKDWYVERAKQEVLPRVGDRASQMGVDYEKAKIVDNRFRWGSCTPKGNIHLNWRLIKAPTFVIDYVIIHELAHLLENNHTPRFWGIINAHMAQSEKAKRWLKEHGQLLEQVV